MNHSCEKRLPLIASGGREGDCEGIKKNFSITTEVVVEFGPPDSDVPGMAVVLTLLKDWQTYSPRTDPSVI